jgi:SAM-dependent methyltransferase
VPLILATAQIAPDRRVLDVGCGTGGFTRALAETGAAVTGLDASERFIEFAREFPPPQRGTVAWVVGDAEKLPFEAASFDRVLHSLVLHQLSEPERAVAEAWRVLDGRGIVAVRTIAPEDASARVPERFLPSMAAADSARLPSIQTVEEWLLRAGFELLETRRVLRNKRLILEDEERQLLVEVRSRYPFIEADELEEGRGRMRAEARRAGEWIDPRPTYFVVGSKSS